MSLHGAESKDWIERIIIIIKVFTGLYIPKTENTNCMTSGVKKNPTLTTADPLCLLAGNPACVCKCKETGSLLQSFTLFRISLFLCWNPTKGSYRSQHELIFLLKTFAIELAFG